MEKPQSRSIYRFRGKLRWITFVVICLVLVSTIPSPSFSWSNGGFSSNPSNPKYGTHDWIAEHALDWLPLEVKQWLLPYRALYLYGTELPDNGQAPDGIGDTQLHHIYFYADGRLMDDSAAVRANATYRQALSYMLKGDFSSAAKYAGAMTHYISDMAVFGHVMGKYTPWGEEKHHSDYEDYVNSRTSSYYAEFNVYLKFDGKLEILTAYNAAIKLAYDTTFDSSGRGLTCVWMDQNYDWSNPTFKNRAGESLNLAVNFVADVLYTLYMEYKSSQKMPTTAIVKFEVNGLDTDISLLSGPILTVDGTNYYYNQLPINFTWNVGSTHSFSWSDSVSSTTSGKRYVWVSTSGLSTARSGTITVPSEGGSISATYKTQFQLTISVSPLGTGTTNPAPGSYWYDSSTSVQVSATAYSGYMFSHWLLDDLNAGSNNPITVNMSVPHSLTAVFSTATCTLTVYIYKSETTTGIQGVTVKVDGTSYTTDLNGKIQITVTYGYHTVEVVSPYSPSSGTRYVFTRWSDNLTNNPRTITITTPITLIAYMKLQHRLMLAVNPLGSGSISVNPSSLDGYYDDETSITLTAIANSGYAFDCWTGSVSETSSSVSLIMNEPKSITANFFTFSISAYSSSNLIPAGGSVTVTVTINYGSGVNQKIISLSASNLPSGISVSFNPISVMISPNSQTAISTMTINTSTSTPTGTYTITITGSGGGLSRSTQYILTITAPTYTVNFYVYDDAGSIVNGATLVFNGQNYSHGKSTNVVVGTYSLSTGIIPSGYRFKQWETSGGISVTSSTSTSTTATISSSGSITMRLQRVITPRATQLTLSPETFTITSGQSVTLTVKLTSDGQPLADKQIVFTATLGSINPSIVTTDANGVASTVYTAPKLSARTSVAITASFLGDITYERSTAICQGIIEVELPKISISGASFNIPKTLKDDISSYRKTIPDDVLKLLPITLPSESFILVTSEDFYLVFADQIENGLAHVEGWKLPQDINLKGISMGIIVAKSVTFEKEGIPVTISEILANPNNYKFKLVKINADRRQISILYDPDEPPYMEFPITVGYLIEKPMKPSNVLEVILKKAKDFALKLDEQLIKSFLETEEKERIWLFNFEYEYWYDAPTVTNGIIIPTEHPIFKLINQSMPSIGKFANLDGKIVLYDIKTDIPYEEVTSISELKANYNKYLGKVVKLTANCYGGYISIQEVIEHNTPCSENYVYIEGIGCINIVVDARLEGLAAWNKISIPPKRDEIMLVTGVSSFHLDEQFVNINGVFELIGKVVSTKQISDSLPEDVTLVVYEARKVGELDFEKLAQQVKDEIKGDVGELYWVLQNIYPYEKQPSIPYKLPKKVFNPKAPIFVKSSRDIPEIYVDRNFTINIAVASPETPIKLNITNSHISSISITVKEVATNVTIFFEKLVDKPPTIPEPPGLVYAYHEISVNISKEALKGANITFWISKEWLANNKVAAESIVMLRYHAKEWTELPTRIVDENATHLKFTAETPGFSIFVIITKMAMPPTITTGVEGYVKDEAGKPISGVKVAVISKTIGRVCEAKTDDVGHYFMEISPGEYVLVFSAIGYADGSVNVSLSSGEVKRVDYTLKSAVAEFLEDWGGVKFEVALMGNLTWEVCSNATIKVSVTVHDMGGNVEVEFKQLKLYFIDGAVSQTVPINARLSVGGLAFTREASLTILYGFSYLAPGTSETKQLRLSLEGSYVDKYGASWPKLSEENVNVKVYAPQTPISITIDAPETIHVGEEFTIKVKLKNEGKYQIRDVELELETPTATSLLSPGTTGINMLNPGGEFTATFKLRAEGAATSQIYIGYITFRTLWDYHVWQPHMNLGSIVISKVPTSISITVEPRQVTVGESVNVKGAITPAMNTQITLTVKEPDGSTKTFSTTSYLDGTFTFTVKLDKEGKYTFTASFQGDTKYEATKSSEVYVEVKPAPPPLWLYAIVAICIITIIAIIVIKIRR